jgi:hypothetical protein
MLAALLDPGHGEASEGFRQKGDTDLAVGCVGQVQLNACFQRFFGFSKRTSAGSNLSGS